MPTQKYFDKYPAFPNDVPTAELPRISFAKLLAGEEDDSAVLFEACRAVGFFLLDFQDCPEGQEFLKKAENMFDINEKVNSMDTDELMKYQWLLPSGFRYKGIGGLKIEDGRPDRFQCYTISRDDMSGISEPLSNPPLIEAHRAEINDYMEQAQSIIALICSHLERQLRLPPGSFMSLQPKSKPSGTSLRMLHHPPQPADDQRVSMLGHTDIGTLTILFNLIGGLQLMIPGADAHDEGSWLYVQPVPGCAIVNVGDAMVEWTAGILRSNLHRVTSAPGEQSKVARYSLAYLVRPDGDAPMKRLACGESLIPGLEEGEKEIELKARDWEKKKNLSIVQGRDPARSRGGRAIMVGK